MLSPICRRKRDKTPRSGFQKFRDSLPHQLQLPARCCTRYAFEVSP